MEQKYIATVNWVSPQHGGLADINKKMLSLLPDLTDETGYIAFDGQHGEERYLFDSEFLALAFKAKVEDAHHKDPQYFVIDDAGETVLEDGKPLVAWRPEVVVEAATSKHLERYFVCS